MNAAEYLGRIIYTEAQINANLEELDRIRATMRSIPSPVFDKEIRSASAGSRTERLDEKLFDLEKLITDEIDDLVDMKREALTLLRQLEDQQQRIVLQAYYISGKSIEAIAESLYLSYRRIQAIKAEGLENFQAVIERQHVNS